MHDHFLTHENPLPTRALRCLPIVLVAGAFSLIPLLVGGLDQPFLIQVFTRVLVFAIAAVSLNILVGFAGLISVMHAALLGIGGYTVAILASHVETPFGISTLAFHGTADLLVSVPLAIFSSALISAILATIALRTRGAYFIMITLAFNQMLYYFFVSLNQYGGDEGLQVTVPLTVGSVPLTNRLTIYYVFLAILIVTLIFSWGLFRSRFGMVLRAASGNERRLASVGIAATPYQIAAFVIAGSIAGLSGALLVISQQFVSPADMSWTRSGELIVMVALGGLSTVWGPVIGTAVFLLVETTLSNLTIHWQLPFGLLIILMVTFLRHGISGINGLLRANQGGARQ